jgi:hypothetical protein
VSSNPISKFKIHFFQPLFISGITYPNISEIHLVKSRLKTYYVYNNLVKPHKYFSFGSRIVETYSSTDNVDKVFKTSDYPL